MRLYKLSTPSCQKPICAPPICVNMFVCTFAFQPISITECRENTYSMYYLLLFLWLYANIAYKLLASTVRCQNGCRKPREGGWKQLLNLSLKTMKSAHSLRWAELNYLSDIVMVMEIHGIPTKDLIICWRLNIGNHSLPKSPPCTYDGNKIDGTAQPSYASHLISSRLISSRLDPASLAQSTEEL